MFSQRLKNLLSPINHNNCYLRNGSLKLIFHHRKLHQYNGTLLKINLCNRSHDKYRNSHLYNISTVRNLRTDIITKDNIVKSPYEDVIAPDCLLHESVWCNADKWPDMIAIECGIVKRRYTFSQLRKYARNFAASLRKSGLKPGEVVSVILPNIPEYPIALFGASEAGLIVSPANPAYTADEICHQLNDSKSVCVITYAYKLDTVKEAISKLEQKLKKPVSLKLISIQDYDGISREYPTGVWSLREMFENNIDTSILDSIKVENDIALLPYSSGTTGLPKGVCLTHRNMVTNVNQIGGKEILMNIEPEGNNQDVFPVVLPFFHIYGLVIILMCSLRHGGRCITLPKFEPETYINTLSAHKSNILYSVPPLVLFLASHPGIKKEMFEQVRFVLSAAAPIGQSDIEKLMDNLPQNAVFKQGYGLTETSPIVLMDDNETKAFTSVGPPAPLTQLKVIDVNTGKNLGVDESGELCVYGPQVMKGYLNRPEATLEMIDKDGWLHTGDIGSYDKNGRFYIVDRIKELIKVKGFQVAPAELEEILRCHPKVADAAVIGIPDEKAGELPVAFVVPKTEHKSVPAEELKQFVDEKVTKYKRLADIIFTDEIPKNPSGKILRRKIRDKYLK